MRTVHVLRKFNRAEWGGTESAVNRLLHGLNSDGVESVVFCPRPDRNQMQTATSVNGAVIRHFNACVPVWGLSESERRQFVAVGGNLFSFDLLSALWCEPDVELIHSHTLGRLGAIAGTVARRRRVPFVVTIHGGYLDLPAAMKREFHQPSNRGFDWGRIFGLLLKSRQMLEHADAILTCNPTEAALLQEKFPYQRVQVMPHGIDSAAYQLESREVAFSAWPQLRNRQVLLCVGRIDAVKNQRWLVEQGERIFKSHPNALLVFAGPSTDSDYSTALERLASERGWQDKVFFTGGLPPGDRRLIGLFQLADVVILPSISETFGLVLLEAWAAGTVVLASCTSGAKALIEPGENGGLFDLETPESFHELLDVMLNRSDVRQEFARVGQAKVLADYDLQAVARRTRQLYHQLIEAKSCAT